jgi:hypothetical protein
MKGWIRSLEMRNDIEWEKSDKKTNLQVIKKFENKIGYILPKNYVDFILKYNGTSINNYIYSFKIYSESNNRFEGVYSVGIFLSYGTTLESIDWYWDNRNSDENYPFPDHVIPFILGGEGNLICFDYRHNVNTEDPKIVYWNHEERGQLKEGFEIYYIANSFDDFVEKLSDFRTEEEKKDDEDFRKRMLES